MEKNTYLLTGGTGFLGSLLSIELLKEGSSLVFLGRSKRGVHLKDRILSKISSVDSDFHLDESRIRFVEADVSTMKEDAVGDISAVVGKIDGIWHLAADLSFKKSERNSVFNTNINGTKNIARIAEILQAPLYYVSTAYVHGSTREKVLYEKSNTTSKRFRNPYEASKNLAEQVVIEWSQRTGSTFIIFRPTILIDLNSNINSLGLSGILHLLRILRRKTVQLLDNPTLISRLFRKLGRRDGTLIVPVPFPYNLYAHLNLMPIDIAVNWMIKLASNKASLQRIFHIANPQPFTTEFVIKAIFSELRLVVLTFPAPMSVIYCYLFLLSFISRPFAPARSFFKKLRHYQPYMTEDIRYDLTNTRDILGNNFLSEFSFPPRSLKQFISNFVDRVDKKGG